MKSKVTAASAVPQGVARTENNRRRRLLRVQKRQPNNKQVELALLSTGTKRKAPVTRQWSHSNIAIAKLFKEFCGYAPKELFSSNPKAQQDALALVSRRQLHLVPQGKVDFSIGARAFMREGKTWS